MTETRLFPPFLDEGSSGAAVKFLQVILIGRGIAVKGLVADGAYGPLTAASIRRVQQNVGLRGANRDGNLGPRTRERCRVRGFFDFDAVPLMAIDGNVTTQWFGPDSKERMIWPPAPASEEDRVELLEPVMAASLVEGEEPNVLNCVSA